MYTLEQLKEMFPGEWNYFQAEGREYCYLEIHQGGKLTKIVYDYNSINYLGTENPPGFYLYDDLYSEMFGVFTLNLSEVKTFYKHHFILRNFQ